MINQIDIAQNASNDTAPGLPSSSNDAAFDEDALIAEITTNLKDGRKHWADWRQEAKEDYDFFAGKQWDAADIAKLDDEERPVVTFNRCVRTVNAVAGYELQNRQEVRYIPRRNDATGVNETLTNAGKWARDNCDAEDEESEAFQDSITCGMGWTETRMDYEIESEGQIIDERVDPFDMLVDPYSKKRNFSDARWVARIKEISKKELLSMWPDAEVLASQFWLDNDTDNHDATEAPFYRNDQSDKMPMAGRYVIVQYQWWEREPIIKALDPATGKLIEIPPEKMESLQQIMALQGMTLRTIKGYKRVYKQVFYSGKQLLEPPKVMDCPHFTFQAITGLRDRNRGTWFGLIRLMKDPQRWANKWLSQIQYILNTGAKSGLIAEKSAITNPRKFEDDYAQPGSISLVNDGAISQGKIKEKTAPEFPEGIDRLLQYALSAINDVTGVSLELIGMTDRDQAIGLEESRKKAGMVILANFFDSLRRYRKAQGRVMAYYIKEYISDGRLIRIVGQEGAEYVPLLKDDMTYEYDVIVDDAPTSPDMKERVFMVITQILPMLLQAGIPVPPDVLDYAPLPDALTQKWKNMIAKGQNDPTAQMMKNIQQMLAQLSVQEKQAEIEKTKSETVKNYGQAEQAHGIGQDQQALAMQKVGHTQQIHHQDITQAQQEHQQNLAQAAQEHQVKTNSMIQDQHRKDLELLLNQARKAQEAKSNAQIKAKQISISRSIQ